MNKRLTIYEVIFKVTEKQKEIEEIQKQSEAPGFWNDQKNAQALFQKAKSLQIWVDAWNKVDKKQVQFKEFIELAELEMMKS